MKLFFLLLLSSLSAIFSFNPARFNNRFMKRQLTILQESKITNNARIDYNNLSEQDMFDLQWYVIGEKKDFVTNKPNKVTVWDNNYVVWKNLNNTYVALDDACPHKGASLSCGKVTNGKIMCPYHGYEFNDNGILEKVPGICFKPSEVYNLKKYDVVEKNGWIYLNTMLNNGNFTENIFVEEDAYTNCKVIYQNFDFNAYSRLVSENSLDIMHIAYVHTFGNAENPNPTYEDPPKRKDKFHYKTTYEYISGKDSMARQVFKMDNITVENEFVLPHTTIARVYFGGFVNTVVTFALPISYTKTKLFVKTYRNFWNNGLGDLASEYMMYNTVMQDKFVLENIDMRFKEGKFNMKFDKLQNTYKTFYKKFIKDI